MRASEVINNVSQKGSKGSPVYFQEEALESKEILCMGLDRCWRPRTAQKDIETAKLIYSLLAGGREATILNSFVPIVPSSEDGTTGTISAAVQSTTAETSVLSAT